MREPREAAAALLCTALHLDCGSLESFESAPGTHRNEVWRAGLADARGGVYLKVQGGPLPSWSVRDEASVLAALADTGLPVPRLMACGELPDAQLWSGGARSYLVTAELPGLPLQEVLRRCREATRGVHDVVTRPFAALADSLLALLRELQDAAHARDVLTAQMPGLVGPFQPDYDPFLEARWLVDHEDLALPARSRSVMDRELRASPRPARAPRLDFVHGSLVPHSVLVLRDPAGALELTGVLDFEGAHLGDAMSDVATFALELIGDGYAEAAGQWLRAAGGWYGQGRVRSRVPAFALAILFRRLQRATGRSRALELLAARRAIACIPRACANA